MMRRIAAGVLFCAALAVPAFGQAIAPGEEGELANFLKPDSFKRTCYAQIYTPEHLATKGPTPTGQRRGDCTLAEMSRRACLRGHPTAGRVRPTATRRPDRPRCGRWRWPWATIRAAPAPCGSCRWAGGRHAPVHDPLRAEGIVAEPRRQLVQSLS